MSLAGRRWCACGSAPSSTLSVLLPARSACKHARATLHTSAFNASLFASSSSSRQIASSDSSCSRLQRPKFSWLRLLFALGWIPVAAFVTSRVCSIGNVTGASMSPTINGQVSEATGPGARSDVVFLNRSVQVLHNYNVGDIVVLVSPLEPRLLLTKRIVALPGDSVRVWAPAAQPNADKGQWTRIKIPPGHVWIEGDADADAPGRATGSAQTKSRDSREFGPVPMGLITSRVDYILWPPRRFGRPASRPGPSKTTPSQSERQAPSSMQDEFRSFATQVDSSLSRILDELTKVPTGSRPKAHPDDSMLSPFVDWADPKRGDDEEARVTQTRYKHMWNNASRGGRLGDDAGTL